MQPHIDWTINVSALIALVVALITALRAGVKMRDAMRDGLKDMASALSGLSTKVAVIEKQQQTHEEWLVNAGFNRRHQSRRER